MTKQFTVTRPAALEYSPTKSVNSLMNNEPVNIVTKNSPLDRLFRSGDSPDAEKTPKVKKMRRNISSKGNKRNLTIESSAKSTK